jgi:hypothetical protein
MVNPGFGGTMTYGSCDEILGTRDLIMSPLGEGARVRAAAVEELLGEHEDMPYCDWRLALWSTATAPTVPAAAAGAGR